MSQLDKYRGHALDHRSEKTFAVSESTLREIQTNHGGWRVLRFSVAALCIAGAFALIVSSAQGDKVIIIQNGDGSSKMMRF